MLTNPVCNTLMDNLKKEENDTRVASCANIALIDSFCNNLMATAQFFSLFGQYKLRREDNCATVYTRFPQWMQKLEMSMCYGQGGKQEWANTMEGKMEWKVILKATKKYLDVGRGLSLDLLCVIPCQIIPSDNESKHIRPEAKNVPTPSGK